MKESNVWYAVERDQWIDVLYWRSVSEAKAAAREAESSTDCAPPFALIDMENDYVYVHGEPAASQVLA